MAETSFDPWDPATVADPYSAYRLLRDAAPLHHNPDRDIWVLARHGDVRRGLHDPGALSSADGVARFSQKGMTFVGEDPPIHTKHRSVVQRAFTSRGIERHRDGLTAAISAVVESALSAGTIDGVRDLANPAATLGLATVLGLPASQEAVLLEAGDAVFGAIGSYDPPAIDAFADPRNLAVGALADEALERRRASDELGQVGDVVDAILASATPNADGWRLTRLDRAVMLTSLVAPGLETTRHLIGNGLDLAASHPEEWQRVCDGEVSPASWVEEVLRFESPIQGFFRTASSDWAVGGEVLPAGARVLLLFGSANRDGAVFTDANRFRANRDPTDHLALGHGIHFCLGAGLARAEASTLFELLARARVPIARAGDGQRSTTPLMRGWSELPLTLS